jgi:hypothetical protein
MEIEYLEKLAKMALKLCLDEVRGSGNLLPKFLLALATEKNAIDLIAIDGPLPMQQEAREKILEPIRSRIAAGEVQAVVFASDVLIGKQEAVVVMVDSPIFRQILRQDYSRVGKAIEFGEHHTNDDPAICRQMIGDFFPGGAKPELAGLATVRVIEEDHVRQLRIPKDVCVAVVSRGSEGRISAKCRNCSVPMATVEKDALLWFRCPRCGRESFDAVANLRQALKYAERHGGTFQFDLYFLEEESRRMMPPPNIEYQPGQTPFFVLASSWRAK